MFVAPVVDLISKISPFLGSALGGPAGALVGSLISKILGGVDMNNHEEMVHVLNDPTSQIKLKELELQLSDLQNARAQAAQDKGYMQLVRPMLTIASMFAIMFDVYAIQFIVTNEVLKDVLIVMLVCLVWDIRKTYSFYFGKGEEIPPFLLKK